jgi:hypothetical protein
MRCGTCDHELSPAEVMRHEEEERDFEDFERECRAWLGPDALDDMQIPDGVGPGPDHLALEADGLLYIPPSWQLPVCDRCLVLGWMMNALYGDDGRQAVWLMRSYHEGLFGCPQSAAMALSWSIVRRQWTENLPAEERFPDEEYDEAVALTEALEARLSCWERHAARAFARGVAEITALHDALWLARLSPFLRDVR